MKHENALIGIVRAYIQQCAQVAPTAEAVCTWKSHMGLAKCSRHTTWSGCARHCEMNHTCDAAQSQCPNVPLGFPAFSEACVCGQGKIFEGSDFKRCVAKDQCWKPCASDYCVPRGLETGNFRRFKRCVAKDQCWKPCASDYWIPRGLETG